MTREEAKSWLRKLYARADITDEYGDMEDMQPYEEAINMAITALSENKGDLISRQKVLNTLDFADNALTGEERTVEKYKELLTECIKVLPSNSENPNKWIPVSERLPETHLNVLLELRSGEMLTGFKAETEPYFYRHGVDACYIEPQNVLAWMPLPKPYKEESEEK